MTMRLLPMAVPLMLVGLASGLARAKPQDAAPLPGKERVFIFFAWDQPILDGAAAQRLDDIATALRHSSDVRIELAGHADRSGPSFVNVRSGRRRAEAVHTYLAARGVPGAAMTVVSYGESRPLVPTQDGVREPQNRRVEIVWTRAPAA